jgi:DNA-binding MltR family transcriptional regulator
LKATLATQFIKTKGKITLASQSNETKFTEAQIKEHIQRIEKVVEKNRAENLGEHFTSVTPDEIQMKLKRVNSPMIVSQ